MLEKRGVTNGTEKECVESVARVKWIIPWWS